MSNIQDRGPKKNQSSKSNHPESNDGSYNLRSTILEGNGIGIAQPAMQSVTDEAVDRVEDLTKIFSQLYRLVVPTIVSKEEWDVTDFHAIDNNRVKHSRRIRANSRVNLRLSFDFLM
jgi:hypothetical protein